VKVIVNDANILIDLVELKLLPHFFALEFEFLTTELVLAELFEEQYQSLLPYIDNGTLIVHEMTGEDLMEIYLIQASKPSLSEQDCSAFYQARQHAATLITSDNTLRTFAKEQELEVHGHLWVFDCMVAANTITGTRACEKLSELCETINPKLGLPKGECARRIKLWKKL
jgi:predicted nucleic acid-binding protein